MSPARPADPTGELARERPSMGYRDVLSLPGALRMSAAGFVGRWPVAMISIATIFLVQEQTGSYAVAGATSAAFALAAAVGAPVSGLLADRFGQARVLVPQLAVHVLLLVALAAVATSSSPRAVLYTTAGAAGLSAPTMAALVRTRWTVLTAGGPGLPRAFALESMVDELIFMTGPMLVTLVVTQASPAAALFTAAALQLVGGLAFAAQTRTEPALVPRSEASSRSAIGSPSIRVLVASFTCLGLVLGSMNVSVVAMAELHDDAAAAGWALALFSVGSLATGLWFGKREWVAGPARRFACACAALVGGVGSLQLASSLPLLGALLVLAGAGLAPTLISGFGLVGEVAPRARVSEAFAWVGGALAAGSGLGSALGGAVVDRWSPAAGFAIALAAAATATAVAWLSQRLLAAQARHPARTPARTSAHTDEPRPIL